MKRFFKTLSVLFFALCVGIFSMIAYGSVYLPDSVTAAHAEQDIGGIYFGERLRTGGVGGRARSGRRGI